MDQQEFAHRTQLIKEQLGDEELFRTVEREARQDERVRNMAAHIKQLRVAKRVTEASSLVESNRDLIDEVRREILVQHGVKLDIQELEEEQEKKRLKELQKINDGLKGDETEDELLRAFHLTDEEGHFNDETFSSPLFRERTRLAFEAYIKAVSSFKALVDYNQMFGVRTKNVGKADALRRDAHNAVSREVSHDLGLDMGVSRNLVAKIRDAKMPRSGEKDTYARSIIRVGRRLSERYGDDIAEVMHEQLGSLLDEEHKEERQD